MKIAFDGGAFQHGIAGGIFNVAVGFLNAATEIDPSFSYVLVADPRLGPVRREALAQLTANPEIVYGEVAPAYDGRPRGLITTDPRVRFEIDGRIVSPAVASDTLTYEGPTPRRSFNILSRAARPSDTLGTSDSRLLGIAIQAITWADSKGVRHISISDPKIQHGFQAPEGSFRWTDGCAQIPVSFFDTNDDKVKINIGLTNELSYRLLSGVFDESYIKLQDLIINRDRFLKVSTLESKLLQMGVEVYFVNHFIPAKLNRITTVSWLYDMIPVIFPSFFMADAQSNFSYNVSAFQRSAHVFSISKASRDDLIRLERLAPEQVSDVGIDIDREFCEATPEVIASVVRTRGLSEKSYIICVGTLEPRKNHVNLVRAFDRAFRSRGFPFDLVIVGKVGWGCEPFWQVVNELSVGDVVRVMSDVSNAELVALYSGALFCAYASIYEGFGLPVLEAMACGCPVLTSNVSSMPEIAGEAAIYVDPSDVVSIARGLTLLADDLGLRRMLADRGLRNRRRYDWKLTAHRVLERLESIAVGDL